MEEKIFSGYCRCLDQNRMVTVETQANEPAEVDCAYWECIHRPQCTVAAQIAEFLEK